MDEEYWSAVRSVRLDVADLLGSLRAEEWEAPSLCRGWRVRDVAGHLALVPTITTWQMMAVAPRCRFDPNRINTFMAVRHGSRPTGQIISAIREHAGDRRTAKLLDPRDSLFDVVVHSQDIAVPLGRDLPVSVAYARRGLDRVWQMGWPFHARRRLAGLTLRATDSDWTAGEGPEVVGTSLSLLLLLTGRTSTVVDSLEGPGTDQVRGSVQPWRR